jgi:putative SOS response-associated peptidase YedK
MTVEAGDREIVPMRWVIVGSSGPDPTHATFNARSETVETSSLWRVPFQFRKRRCLVPAPANVEWRKPEREPFRFELVDQPIVALPGLWDVWRNPADGTWLQSCSVLTTFANTLADQCMRGWPISLMPHIALWPYKRIGLAPRTAYFPARCAYFPDYQSRH